MGDLMSKCKSLPFCHLVTIEAYPIATFRCIGRLN